MKWTIAFLVLILAIYVPKWIMEEFTMTDPAYRKLATAQGHFVKVRGVPVHYILDGNEDGELVLVLHGITASAYMMRCIAEPMVSQGYRVLSFDFYGRGHSSTPLEDVMHDEKLLVNQTSEILTALEHRKILSPAQLKRFHIVALSLGGSVAVVYSSENPEKVQSLTLLAPAGLKFDVPLTTYIGSIPGLWVLLRATALGRYLLDVRIPRAFVNPAISLETIREFQMLNHYHLTKDDFVTALLSTLNYFPFSNTTYAYKKVGEQDYPVMIIWGDKDMTVPISCMKEAKQLIPRAKTITLENTGHMALMEKNNETMEAIFDFLQKNSLKNVK